ncbi:hypothetical protein M0R45_030337 [Rubus argutus]|uniref:Helicase SMUBP-2/HCS1 1B domain-containing protein n=1 Tax=Rubus argutus TaxID=59490 RepID=A0AAW1WAZ4_RUBAR
MENQNKTVKFIRLLSLLRTTGNGASTNFLKEKKTNTKSKLTTMEAQLNTGSISSSEEGKKWRHGKKQAEIPVDQSRAVHRHTAHLIDLEKEAEISTSISTGATRNLDTAQKRGSAILNLKCVDAQTGLMWKTLLEFQSTKKDDVLPPHKCSF